MDPLNDWPTWLLIVALLALMMGANELGFRLGRRHFREESEMVRNVSNTLKASVFGLVALLLGFSFSMTASRHDQRRKVVLEEANAAGTCYLRAGLLAEPERTHIRDLLRKYVAVRLELYEKGLDPEVRKKTNQEIDRLLAGVWTAIENTSRTNSEAVRTSLIVPAANAVIDLSSTRVWTAHNHLPTPVFVLLVACVLVSSLLMGHSSGQSGKRHTGLWTSLRNRPPINAPRSFFTVVA